MQLADMDTGTYTKEASCILSNLRNRVMIAVSLAVSIAVSLGMRDDTREPIPHSRRMEEEGVGSRSGRRRVERRVRL